MNKNIISKNPKKLFWISLFINLSVLTSVITLFYFHRGLDLYQISILGAAVSWAIVLLEIPTGMFSDVVGRKKTVVIGIICLIIYGAIYIFAKNFLMFIIGSLFFALSTSLFSGCITAIIYDSLKSINKEYKIKDALAKYRSASIIGTIMVPPIASFIAKDLLDYQFIILLIIGLIGYLIALIISLSLQEVPIKHKNKMNYSILLKNSFRTILKSKPLLKMTLNQGVGFVCILVFFSILWQPFFKEQGIPVSTFGTIFAISNISLLLMLKNITKIEGLVKVKRFIFLSSFIPGITCIIMGIYPNYITALAGFFIIHILISIRDPLFMHYKNRYIDSVSRATTISIISMIYSLLALVIQPIMGIIANKSLRNVFLVLGLILIISPIIFKVKNYEIDKKD